MSGGVAYVLDEAGDFRARCNLAMVDLEPLVDTDDVEMVKDLLARHIRYTQSPVAARLLVDWDAHPAAVRQGDARGTTSACSWP